MVAVPAVLLGWLRLQGDDELPEVAPAAVPVVAAGEDVLVDDAQPVGVRLTRGDAPEVVAPLWQGTTTAVHARSGAEVVSGDEVVTVDGVARLAWAVDRPFWRPLRAGDMGEDVAALQGLLAELGHFDGEVDASFGDAVADAVRALADDLGVRPTTAVFDPGWIVWLPSEPFLAEGVEARPGSPVVPHGERLLVGPSTIEEVEIAASEGADPELEGEWLLDVEGATYDLADGALGAEDRGRMASAHEEATELSGVVRRKEPVPAVRVPATAVVSGPDGDLCVWVPAEEGFEPHPVSLGGGRVGNVHVVDGVSLEDELLLNPSETLADPVCP